MDFPLTSSSFELKYLGAALGLSFFFYLLGISPVTSALMCLAIALVASFSYSGVELSKDYTDIRNYTDIVSWRIGTWRPLPPVLGVTIKYFSALQSGTPAAMTWGTWRTSSRRLEELVVMLSVEHSRQGIIIGRAPINQYNQVLLDAQRVAEVFAVPVNTYVPTHLSTPLISSSSSLGVSKQGG